MSQHVTSRRTPAALALAAVLGLFLTACSSPGGTATPTVDPPVSATDSPATVSPSDEPSASATATPSADPANPDTWTITHDGMGPVVIGASFVETSEMIGTRGWTSDPVCANVSYANPEGGGYTIYYAHDEQDASRAIDIVDVQRATDASVTGPHDASGIGIGSARADVMKSYPTAEEQTLDPADPGGYDYVKVPAEGTGAAIWFAFHEDSVVRISVTTRDRPPYELCA